MGDAPVRLLLQVEADRLLAPVEGSEVLAEAVGVRRPLTEHVPVRRLDLDHVGAEIRQQHAAVGTGGNVAQLDHPYT